jgi:hypothetical protein
MNSINTDQVVKQIFAEIDKAINECLIKDFREIKPYDKSLFKKKYEEIRRKLK